MSGITDRRHTVQHRDLVVLAGEHLRTLCREPDRSVGSDANRAATGYFAERAMMAGFAVDREDLECIRWENDGTELQVTGKPIPAHTGPYSLSCDCDEQLCVAGTVAELKAANVQGKLLMLRGELVAEQLMPKNFPFYNPDSHRRIVRLVEEKAPAAVIGVTGKNPGLAGAWYPFPLFEDGDFDIPNAYIRDVDGAPVISAVATTAMGADMRASDGVQAHLRIESIRVPSTCEHLVARRGSPDRRILLTAHIDSKEGSPGAADNGGGVVVLLLLLDLLAEMNDPPAVEVVPFNGEDYYACPGQIRWVEENHEAFGNIVLGLNLDGVGLRNAETAFSLYECGDLEAPIRSAVGPYGGIVEGEQWYQGDHSIFMQNGVPAVAVTTMDFKRLSSEIAHTTRDVPEIIDPDKLVEVALAIRDLLGSLSASQS